MEISLGQYLKWETWLEIDAHDDESWKTRIDDQALGRTTDGIPRVGHLTLTTFIYWTSRDVFIAILFFGLFAGATQLDWSERISFESIACWRLYQEKLCWISPQWSGDAYAFESIFLEHLQNNRHRPNFLQLLSRSNHQIWIPNATAQQMKCRANLMAKQFKQSDHIVIETHKATKSEHRLNGKLKTEGNSVSLSRIVSCQWDYAIPNRMVI